MLPKPVLTDLGFSGTPLILATLLALYSSKSSTFLDAYSKRSIPEPMLFSSSLIIFCTLFKLTSLTADSSSFNVAFNVCVSISNFNCSGYLSALFTASETAFWMVFKMFCAVTSIDL